MNSLILTATLSLAALAASAETARWPQRIVETVSTVHLLTGTISAERSTERTSTVVVDITKITRDGATFIQFKRRATKSMIETESETGRGSLPWERRQDLVDALIKAKAEMSRVSTEKDDRETNILDDPAMKMILARKNKKLNLIIELGENDSSFELGATHVTQFIDLMKRIK